jgi:hypothetical protein
MSKSRFAGLLVMRAGVALSNQHLAIQVEGARAAI